MTTLVLSDSPALESTSLSTQTTQSLEWADRISRFLPGLLIVVPLILNLTIIALATPSDVLLQAPNSSQTVKPDQ